MKIYPVIKGGRPQWCLTWQKNGKQTRRFFRTAKLARQFVRETDELRAPGMERLLTLPESEMWDLVKAVDMARVGGFTALEAVEAMLSGRENDKTVEAAWKEFIDLKEHIQGMRPKSLQNLRGLLPFLQKHFEKPVNALCTADVLGWIRLKKWAPQSRISFLTNLNVYLNWCRNRGWMDILPTAAIPAVLVDVHEVGILTAANTEALMRAIETTDSKLIPYATLCLFCGLRPSEAMRVRWSHIDLKAALVDLTAGKTKTRRARFVTISSQAAAWFELGGDLPIVNWRRRWDLVREAAGLVRRVETTGPVFVKDRNKTILKKRWLIDESNWPHDCMRHSWASHFIPLHGFRQASIEGGNSEAVLATHYRKPLPKEESREYFAILPA